MNPLPNTERASEEVMREALETAESAMNSAWRELLDQAGEASAKGTVESTLKPAVQQVREALSSSPTPLE
jgi:phage gp29-like protein